MAIPPVSAFTSLCLPSTKPPFLRASACSIVNLAPQPSQHLVRSTNPNPYLRHIPSLHSSLLRKIPLTIVNCTEIQAPVSELRLVLRSPSVSMGTRREESAVAELACLADWAAVCPSCIASWWSTMTRDVPSSIVCGRG